VPRPFLPASAVVAARATLAVGVSDRQAVSAIPVRNSQLVSASSQARGDPGPDFNRDGYADLAVGVPYENLGAAEDAGAVQVIYGSSGGLKGDGPPDDQFWTEDDFGLSTTISEANEHFGYALAGGDFDGDGFDDLAIGVPNKDVNVPGIGVRDAGVVYVLRGSSSGLTASRLLNQRTIHRRPDPYEHFGFSLAAGDFGRGPMDDLAIGVPGESDRVHNVPYLGSVNVVYGSPGGLTGGGSQEFSESSHPMPWSAGDGYGFSLEAADFGRNSRDDLVVGAPYRDVSGKKDVGWVFVIYASRGGLTTLGQQSWGESSRMVPGAAEREDRFGWTLAAGDFGRGIRADLAVGAPFDGPGATGSVVILYSSFGRGLSARGSQRWSQGSPGVPGNLNDGDFFGFALAAADFGKGPKADLAVGVPLDRRGKVGGRTSYSGAAEVSPHAEPSTCGRTALAIRVKLRATASTSTGSAGR
jgi:FG-GAP repeat